MLAVMNGIYAEVVQGINLEHHLADCEAAIIDINNTIAEIVVAGGQTSGYRNLKNQIFSIVYEIKERT